MKNAERNKYFKYGVIAVVACLLAVILWPKSSYKPGAPRDFDEIKSEGILRAATEYNAVGYYVKEDTIVGFHYSLINAFAKSLGLKAEITPVMSFDERLKGLAEGKYDIIAYSTAVIGPLRDSLLFSSPIVRNKLVLVQRKADGEDDSLYIGTQINLAGRTIHLAKGSPEVLRIRNLENEIGDTIYIEEIDKYGSEQLIEMVSHGDINYTVCDETTARNEVKSLGNIDIGTDIGFTQFYSWATSKQSPALMDSLNAFLKTYTRTNEYKELYNKYYNKQ